ncbi:MAG TPA: electron transfer flavoprotein subunit alpha/FixB family protein, partial [Azospirillaceae bacterium]|nr:electron transfer flavoprotein subunit alpha/FixB family protein [Azospirillaceae bacterium]
MKTLVIAEIADGALKPATLNAVAAAKQVGGDVHVLVAAGEKVADLAAAAAAIDGVAQVVAVEAPAY